MGRTAWIPWLVNARDVKNLPGRPKTDALDAVWLCKVAERGCAARFVPPKPIRRCGIYPLPHRSGRRPHRGRRSGVEKLLEDACIKLSVVAADIFGVSGRAMMAALIAGERDPKALAQLARARARPRSASLEEAFTGTSITTTRSCLPRCWAASTRSSADIAAVDGRMIEAHRPLSVLGTPVKVDPLVVSSLFDLTSAPC